MELELSMRNDESVNVEIKNFYDQVSELIGIRNDMESQLFCHEKNLHTSEENIQLQQLVIQKIRGKITSNPNFHENNKMCQNDGNVDRQSTQIIYSELQSISSELDSTEEYDIILKNDYALMKQKILEKEKELDFEINSITSELENCLPKSNDTFMKIDSLQMNIEKTKYKVEQSTDECDCQQENLNFMITAQLDEQKQLEETMAIKAHLENNLFNLKQENKNLNGQSITSEMISQLGEKISQRKIDFESSGQKFGDLQKELHSEETNEIELTNNIEVYENLLKKTLHFKLINSCQSTCSKIFEGNSQLADKNSLLTKFLNDTQIQLENEILLNSKIKDQLLKVDYEKGLAEEKEKTMIDQNESLHSTDLSLSNKLEASEKLNLEMKELLNETIKKEQIHQNDCMALDNQLAVINKMIEESNNEIKIIQNEISIERRQKHDEIEMLEEENENFNEKIRHSKESLEVLRKLKRKIKHPNENSSEDPIVVKKSK